MLQIETVDFQQVKVIFGEGSFKANMRIVPRTEADGLSDTEVVLRSLRNPPGDAGELGEYRADVFTDLEVKDTKSGELLTGSRLTEFVSENRPLLSALGGAYIANFHNKPLRDNLQ